MKRAKKRVRRGAGVPGARGSLVIGGVTLGSTRHPPGSSRAGAGRLGRALSASKKKSVPRATSKASATKSLARWDEEGGRAQKPATATTTDPKRPATKAKNATPKTEHSAFLAPIPPIPPDLARQRSADARAKDSQIKRAGLESRLLGHVSGQGKRSQARRDSKNG